MTKSCCCFMLSSIICIVWLLLKSDLILSSVIIIYPLVSLKNHDPSSFLFEYVAEMNQMRYVEFGFKLSSLDEVKPWSYHRFICEVIDITRTALTGRSHNASLLIPEDQIFSNELYVQHLFPAGIYDVHFKYEDIDSHELILYETCRFELRITLLVTQPRQEIISKLVNSVIVEITMNIGMGSYHLIEFDMQSHKDWIIDMGKYCSIAKIKIFLARSKDHRQEFITTFPLHFMQSYFSTITDETIIDNSHKITIGNDVWIGKDVVLINNITIGTGSIIGANSVVRENVPNYAVVYGNPARIMKYRFSEETINKLLMMAWWDWDIDRIYEMTKYSTVQEVITAWEQGYI